MKRLWMAMILVALCALLGACAQEPQELAAPPKPCVEVADAIEAGQAFEELTKLSADQTLKYLDLNESLLSDMDMRIDASRASAEAIAVLTAVDEEGLGQAKEALAAYRDVTLEQYRDYRPAEVPKLENAVLKTQGLQTVMIISADAQAAEKALDDIWKK